MEYRHRSYNPFFGGLITVCNSMELEGFMLSHVVSINSYESIAVFFRSLEGELDE